MKERIVILAGGISSRMKKPAETSSKIEERLAREADEKSKSMIGVGGGYRPFLDYLLYNCKKAGYEDIVIVVGENDESVRKYYGSKERDNDFYGLNISYAVQHIPKERTKPLGTADALLQALRFRPDWQGMSFTVCNSDNLYSINSLRMMHEMPHSNIMADYDRNSLKFEISRIEKFAVAKKDSEHYLVDIIEKPTEKEIESVKDPDGSVGVSMNLFRLDYDLIRPQLERVPLHPVRLEKELPAAVVMMTNQHPKSCYACPLKEHVPDLTNKDDIAVVSAYLESEYRDFSFHG